MLQGRAGGVAREYFRSHETAPLDLSAHCRGVQRRIQAREARRGNLAKHAAIANDHSAAGVPKRSSSRHLSDWGFSALSPPERGVFGPRNQRKMNLRNKNAAPTNAAARICHSMAPAPGST